jgi:hypothetical protein
MSSKARNQIKLNQRKTKMANKFVDLVSGNDANDGSTFALRKKTLSSAAAVAAAGDTIRVMGNAPTTSGTANWTNGSSLVTLSAALNQLLYGDGLWTAGTNVTASTVTSSPSPKQGSNASKLATNASFTTGARVGFFATGTLNLSGYQRVSFWIQSSVALASGKLSLNLCSDAAGATIVNTLTLNQALNANQWTAVTLDNGAALGSSIGSVRLTANSSMPSTNIIIDDVVACKAASVAGALTLNSLISPDGATWHHVQSINGTSVYIDGQQATAATAAKGYQGATVSGATFYVLQPTQVTIGANSSTYAQVFSGNGSAGTPITISGGWDSTAMTTQSGWTTIDMSDWTASGVNLTGTTGFITVDHFNFARAANPLGLVSTAQGYSLSNDGFAGTGPFSSFPTRAVTITASNFINTSGSGAMLSVPLSTSYKTDGAGWSITNSKVWGSTVGGIKVAANIGTPAPVITGCDCSGNGAIGFDIQSPCSFWNNTAKGNAAPGINFQGVNGATAYNLVARGNTTGEVQVNNASVEIFTLDTNTPGGSATPQVFFPSGVAGQATVYSWTQYTGGSPAAVLTSLGDPNAGETAGNVVASHRENGTVANNSIYSDYGVITTTGVIGESGAGVGWKLSPNGNALASAPLRLNVGKVPCPAGIATTVTFWAKCSAASGIGAQLKVFGGRYAGVGSPGSDITAAVSGTAWAQYSLTFTPSENCVVDVFFESWGTSTQNATISGPVTITQ